MSLALLLPLAAATPELVTPGRHSGAITDITAGGGGDWAATVANDAPRYGRPIVSIRIWSLPKAIQLRTFRAPGATSLAAHPTKRWLAYGAGYSLVVLDVVSGATVHEFSNLPDQANALAWSPDGSYLLAGWEKLIRIDVDSWRVTQVVPSIAPGTRESIRRMVFVTKGARLAVSTAVLFSNQGPAAVRLFDTSSWQEVVAFGDLKGDIRIAIDPSGSTLAAVGSDLTVRFWSLDDFRPNRPSIPLGPAKAGAFPVQVYDLIFCADGQALGVNASQRDFALYDVASGRRRAVFKAEGHLSAQSLRPVDGKSLAIGGSVSGDFTVLSGDLERVEALAGGSAGVRVRFAAAQNDQVWLGVTSQDADQMDSLARKEGGVWKLGRDIGAPPSVSDTPIAYFEKWNGKEGPWAVVVSTELAAQNLISRERVSLGGSAPWARAVSAEGRWVVGPAEDNRSFLVYDIPNKTQRALATGESNWHFALSPHGEFLALEAPDGQIRLWALPSWKEIPFIATPPRGLRRGIDALCFSPDAKLLAVSHPDDTIRIWRTADASVQATVGEIIGGALSLAFRPDGKRLTAGAPDGRVIEYDADGAAPPVILDTLQTPVEFVGYPGAKTPLLAAGSDGLLSIIDAAKARRVGAFFLQSPAGPWVTVTPAGFFDASESSFDELRWRFGGDAFTTASVARYFGDFFYPGLFGAVWRGAPPAAAADLASIDRTAAEISLRVATPPAPDARTAELELSATGAGAYDLRLFRNGALVRRWNGATTGKVTATVKLQAGVNEFTAYAFNAAKVRSESARLTVTTNAESPRPGVLYVLAVGIDDYGNRSLNLKFAGHDARVLAGMLQGGRVQLADFVGQLGKQKEAARNTGNEFTDERLESFKGSSGRAVTQTLLDRKAGKAAVLDAIRRIAREAQPEDSFIFFFAGHGMADGQSYYLLPADLDYGGPRSREAMLPAVRQKGISDGDLEAALEQMDVASGALIIDACESGAAAQAATDWRRGPIDARGLAQLAYEKDLWLLAASQSYQNATELPRLEHGILTYVLADEGLRAAKAAPRDGLKQGIQLGEWLAYAARRVPELQVEALADKRGLAPNRPQSGAPAADPAQRPQLLARQRPRAAPLYLAAFSVDIDPLSLTLTGTGEIDPSRALAGQTAPVPAFSLRYPTLQAGTLRSVVVSPAGDWLATLDQHGSIRFWRVPDLLPLRSLATEGHWVSMELSPDGTTLAGLTSAAELTLVDVASGQIKRKYTGLSVRGVSDWQVSVR